MTTRSRQPSGMKPPSALSESEKHSLRRSQKIQDLSEITTSASSGISAPVVRPVGVHGTNAADSILSGALVYGKPSSLNAQNMATVRSLAAAGDHAAYNFVQRVARTAGVSSADVRILSAVGEDALVRALRATNVLQHNKHPIIHLPPGTNDRAHNKRAKEIDSSDVASKNLTTGDYQTDDQGLIAPVMTPDGVSPPIARPSNPLSGATAVIVPDAGLIATQLAGGLLDSGDRGAPSGGAINTGDLSSGDRGVPSGHAMGSLRSDNAKSASVVEQLTRFDQGEGESEVISQSELRRRLAETARTAGIEARLAVWDSVARANPGNTTMYREIHGQQFPTNEARPPTIPSAVGSGPSGVPVGVAVVPTTEELLQAKDGSRQEEPTRAVLAEPGSNIQVPGADGTLNTIYNPSSVSLNLVRIAHTPGASATNLAALRAAVNGIDDVPGGRSKIEESRDLTAAGHTLSEFLSKAATAPDGAVPKTLAELPDDIVMLFISFDMAQAIRDSYAKYREPVLRVTNAMSVGYRSQVPLIDLMTHSATTGTFAQVVAYHLLYTRGLRAQGRQTRDTLQSVAASFNAELARLVTARYNNEGFLSYQGEISGVALFNRARSQWNNAPRGARTDEPSMMYGDQSASFVPVASSSAASIRTAAMQQVLYTNQPLPPGVYPTREQLWAAHSLATAAGHLAYMND